MLIFEEEESINYGMICLVGWVSWMVGSFDVATTRGGEESGRDGTKLCFRFKKLL